MVRLGSTPVLDIGTWSVKAGFVGEPYPLLVYTREAHEPDTWPVTRGSVTDWEGLYKLVEVIWTKLHIRPSEEEVLVVWGGGEGGEQQTKLEEMLLGKFSVKHLTVLPAALCVAQAAGIQSGVLVQFGYGVTTVDVVSENTITSNTSVPVGGQDICSHLLSLLSPRYPDLSDNLSIHTRAVLERHCFATLQRDLEPVSAEYTLPCQSKVTLGKERYLALEPIFEKIPAVIVEALKQVAAEDVVICGGLTNLHNFNYRLLDELYRLGVAKTVRIFSPPNREYIAWLGASVIYFDDDNEGDQGQSLSEYLERNTASL